MEPAAWCGWLRGRRGGGLVIGRPGVSVDGGLSGHGRLSTLTTPARAGHGVGDVDRRAGG